MMQHVKAIALLLLITGPAHAAEYCDGKQGEVAYVVDVTTRLNDTEKNRLIAGTMFVMSAVASGQKLTIFTIEDSFSKSRKLFSACRPYCNEKWFGSCNEQAARRDLRRWQTSIAAVARALIESDAPSLKNSDILLTLSSRFTESARSPIRLFLFSDLIENSSVARSRDPHYPKQLKDAVKTLIANRNYPILRGTRVTVFGFGVDDAEMRSDLPPKKMLELRKLWNEFFREFGASDVQIGPFLE